MSFYEFELANGEDLVIEKAGEYTDGSFDLSVYFGNEYRDFYECSDADEVMDWIAEAGGRFATPTTALFNRSYLQSLIDGDWSDNDFAIEVSQNPEKALSAKVLGACGAKADEPEDVFPEIETTAELHVIGLDGEDYDYFEEITIANDPRQPYLVTARWINGGNCDSEEVTVWDFEEDGDEVDLEEVRGIIARYAEKRYRSIEYVEVDGVRGRK